MLKNLIKELIFKQNQEKEALSHLGFVERTKVAKGSEWMSSPLVKVVLGPRRAGKSVFSLMLLKGKPFLYFNFDDPALLGEKLNLYEFVDELHKFYGDTKFVLFDEIQNLKGWELFANRLHRQGYNLILTGSNANLLSLELATHLTGRHIPIEIFPFDFQEFLKAKNFSQFDQKSELLKLLEQYMVFGGFPEVVIKNQHPRGYLDVLFDALLFKDVVKRHKVRFSAHMERLGAYLINNVSNQYSFRKLANVLKFKSNVTLERYLKYLEEAYVVFFLSGFSAKAGERLRSPKKIYTVDNGFVASKAVQHSLDNGKLLENLVFTELVKNGFEPNRELFYYKTRNGKEVDFAIRNGYETSELIQVCYDLRNSDVEQREIKALAEASEELKVFKLTLLTWDEEREVKKEGKVIKFEPVWKWLLARTKS